MLIQVVSGKGVGKTLLSAFDTALKDAGVHNFNLLALSSIIPPNSIVKKLDRFEASADEWGNKLYAVIADLRSDQKGQALAAGLGWYLVEGNKGLFVEHEASGASEAEAKEKVEKDIRDSLSDLCRVRSIPFDESKVNNAISTASVGDQPTCVLTIAIYESEKWGSA